MKMRCPIALLVGLCAGVLSQPLMLQAADAVALRAAPQTGTVTGRVRNVVTGQYLNKARVSIKGTNLTVLTDAFGIYQLVNVPAGPVVVEVFYTDLDVQLIPLEVGAGGTLEQDVSLTSKTRYGQAKAVVELDAFVISGDKETDAQAIATNEQRFAPNIKNVMSTDTLGDTLGSSVGEFLKFIPGLTAEFDNADIAGISVRGIGGAMTSVTTDGAPASNVWVSSTRSVDLRAMALNDISRIEVTKVPTPSTPADSLAGSVNLVGKSAFERSGALLRYGVNLVGNGDRPNLTLKKTPHSYLDRNTYKLLPGFNFDYTLPIGKKFGIVVSGMTNNIYNEQHFTRNGWASSGTGIPASVSRPYLQTYLVLDGPRNITRNTLGLKADWRVTPHSVLSLGGQLNRATTEIGTLQLTFNAGTTGTPTPANGVPISISDNFTIGATGRGSITNNGTNQLINQETTAGNLNYRFDDGRWRIEAALSRSFSLTKRRYEDAGIFYQMISTNRNPIRISFLDINQDRPGRIEVFDNANQSIDFNNIDNYRGTTTNNAQGKNWMNYDSGNINVRRRLDLFSFPSSLQVGGSRRIQTVDLKPNNKNWTFNGPDGNPL
ncbi:MAG: hypothetical protein RIQ93_3458, partial [Verrucomicrobiota bacterium]